MVPPKFSVIRSVVVAVVSTLLVVGVGVLVTLSGNGIPGVSDLANEQRVAGATTVEEPVPSPTVEPAVEETTSPADKAMEDLIRSVEKQVEEDVRTERPARTTVATGPAPARAEGNAAAPYSFQLSSFNILGSNHTRPGGDAKGYAPGRTRAEWAARVVIDRGIDIVGWSEIQPDQYDAVMRATGGAYEAWPGHEYGYKGTPASLMWRTSQFEAVWRGTVTIPFIGQQRPMPIVQLRERSTGREFFVMNVHNAPQGREAERNAAEAKELEIIRSLRNESGLPVFLTGDFNEKAEIFCNVTGTTDLRSASGGSNDGACRPPGGMRVDWIFGSPEATFSGYIADQGASIRRITDHAMIFANVTVN